MRAEAWPDAANADELHDALVWLGFLTGRRRGAGPGWSELAGRAGARETGGARCADRRRATLWIAAERLPQFQALWPEAQARTRDRRAGDLCRARLVARGGAWSRSCAAGSKGWDRSTEAALAAPLGLEPPGHRRRAGGARAEGFALRGRFTPGAARGRMVRAPAARAHPPLYGQAAARRDRAGRGARLPALPVRLAARGTERPHGRAGRARRSGRPARRLRGAGRRLGDRDPAGPPRRLRAGLARRPCLAGRIAWARLRPRNAAAGRRRARHTPVRTTPITLLARRHAPLWAALSPCRIRRQAEPARAGGRRLSSATTAPRSSTSWSTARGCCAPQVEEALAELVALGLVNSDSFAGLRALLVPSDQRRGRAAAPPPAMFGMEDAGRWALARRAAAAQPADRPQPRGGRACRAHPAAPLRRRVLAAARARGGLAAAVARPAARLSPARSARRDPRRPLRRRLLRRAVRAARGGRRAARGPPQAGLGRAGSRCPAPTRSTSSASSPRARSSPR